MLFTIVVGLRSQSVTSIHYWDFNSGAGTAPNKWPSPVNATSTVNAGTLTHNFTVTDNFAGSTLDAPGFTTAAAGASFSVASDANNGNSLVLNASTVGYQGIVLTYATRGTSTGYNTHTIDYSTDGVSYTNLTTITGRTNTSFSLQSVDFSSLPAANNNANFKIRITVTGATAVAGNNRFDNFRITGSLATSNIASISDSLDGAESPNAAAQFTISLSAPAPAGGVAITYRLGGIPKKGQDYNDPSAGTLTIPEGTSNATISLPVIDDLVPESFEYITCQLLSASNGYNFSTQVHTTAIADDEATTIHSASFINCISTLSDSYTQYSSVGAEIWACTDFGNTSKGVQMNGFASNAAQPNEDWLISPAIDLSTSTVPLLSFYSRTRFAGPTLKLLVSTNYAGSGDPSAATWTEVNGKWPATHSDVWTSSSLINLSAFKQNNVYIAFKYTSNGSEGASRWTLDDINVINAQTVPAPLITAGSTIIDLRQTNFGATSAAKQFNFWADNLVSNLIITAPAGFELSKDGVTFTSTITYTPVETANSQITAWARLNPLSANNVYNGYLHFSGTGVNDSKFFMKGHSYISSQTLNVVNWNIEWFGSTANGQGPDDDNLAQANAKSVMEYLDADVYALAEIVDGNRLSNLVSSLAGGYSYVLGEFCSSGGSAAACASAQKLAFVYKTSVLSNVTARPLMNNGVGSNAYQNWSSGRYPYLVTATVNKNGFTKNINFIVLHAKALDDADSYNRRKAAAQELKDTLDTYFSNKAVIILGDFNDDFDSSITATVSPRTTPYDVIIADSTDSDSYHALTFPLSRLSLNSTFENAEMIDHVVVSNEINASYVGSSASLLNDIGELAGVADFPHTTSDHYPVLTNFLMSGILPTKLLAFEAVKKQSAVLVKWTTGRELNSREFVVERSADGRIYSIVSAVKASGSSGSNKNYEYTDQQPLAGTSFYRLRMIDQDGSSELSKVARVYFGDGFSMSLAPNPARNFVQLQVHNNRETATLQLTDLNGKILKELRLASGVSQTINLNISGLARGVYFVKFITAGFSKTEKLVIE